MGCQRLLRIPDLTLGHIINQFLSDHLITMVEETDKFHLVLRDYRSSQKSDKR